MIDWAFFLRGKALRDHKDTAPQMTDRDVVDVASKKKSFSRSKGLIVSTTLVLELPSPLCSMAFPELNRCDRIVVKETFGKDDGSEVQPVSGNCGAVPTRETVPSISVDDFFPTVERFVRATSGFFP